eukprot:gene2986-3269_t
MAAGFSSFKNLPHSSSHPYWLQLTPRGRDVSAETPEQAGPEVEVFTKTSAMNGHSCGGAGHQQHLGPADAAKGLLTDQQQQVTTGDYEVLVGVGHPLMW